MYLFDSVDDVFGFNVFKTNVNVITRVSEEFPSG